MIPLRKLKGYLKRSIRTAVVNQNRLPGRQALRYDRIQCFSQISLAVVKRNDDAHEWGVGLAEFPKLDQMLVSAGVYGAELSHFEGARLIVA